MEHSPEFLTEAEVAFDYKIPQRTLGQWRYLGKGPAYIKVGRHIRYRLADVERWLADNTITPGSAA